MKDYQSHGRSGMEYKARQGKNKQKIQKDINAKLIMNAYFPTV